MAIDLNMDMGAIIKGLLSKNGGNSISGASGGNFSLAAYKFSIIILTMIMLISAGYIYFIYLPLKEKNNIKKQDLAKVIEMKNQLSVLDGQIEMLKKKLDKSKEQYLASLAHFGNSEDLGGLYQTISTLAAKYGVVVLNVKEIPATPPPAEKPKALETKPAQGANSKEAEKKTAKPAAPKKPSIAVKEIKVEVELKGHYGEYIKFKEDLALAEILLKINAESIMVKDEKTEQGSIYAKLNLSTYAIDKKPFEGIISENENENENEKTN